MRRKFPSHFVPILPFILVVVALLTAACNRELDLPTAYPPAIDPTAVTSPSYPLVAGPTAVTPAYPPPVIDLPPPSLEPTSYPNPISPTRTPATGAPTVRFESTQTSFLPIVVDIQPTTTPTPTQTPTPSATPTPSPVPSLDFAAIQAELQAKGQTLAYAKIGFHAGVGGTMAGLEAWMRQLDDAGVPFFIKSTDNAEPLFIAQQMMQRSGVPHTLVYRKASGGDQFDVPNYDLTPAAAARIHWQQHIAAFPQELDPSLVWLETINEVDKNRSEWLAQFALETARLALQDGYNWAAFGWSSGEPEPEDWQSPAMLEFLRLAAANPDRLAIAVHEYSFVLDDIGHEYPYKIGRFLELFRICDLYNIPRPTVLITEWGWTYQEVPDPNQAIDDINWAARLYAPYPQVKGAAIWFLGGGFNDVDVETQRLIRPLTEYSLGHYFVAPQLPEVAPPNPEPYRP